MKLTLMPNTFQKSQTSTWQTLDLEDVLSNPQTLFPDTVCCSYWKEDGSLTPRCKIGQGEGLVAQVMIIDIDHHQNITGVEGKTSWKELWDADIHNEYLASLNNLMNGGCPSHMGWWDTTNGLRVFGYLEKPVPVYAFNSLLRAFGKEVEDTFGIKVDSSKLKWGDYNRPPFTKRHAANYVERPTENIAVPEEPTMEYEEASATEVPSQAERDPSWVFDYTDLPANIAFVADPQHPLVGPHGNMHNTMLEVAGQVVTFQRLYDASEVYYFLMDSPAMEAQMAQYPTTVKGKLFSPCAYAVQRHMDNHPNAVNEKRQVNVLDSYIDQMEEINTASATQRVIDSMGPHITTWEQAQELLVISLGSGEYVWDTDNSRYFGPVVKKSDRLAVYDNVCKFQDLPVGLLYHTTPTPTKPVPQLKPMPLETAIHRYGKVATRLGYTYDDHDKYQKGTLHLNLASKNEELLPVFNEGVDEWLGHLAGDQDGKEYLDNWLAHTPDTSYPLVALFLIGASRTGKSLLAEAIARLWDSGTPIDYDVATSRFNQALTDHPVINGSEITAQQLNGGKHKDHTVFRNLVLQGTIAIEQKNQPTATLKGRPRVLLSSNNHKIFADDKNRGDMEAIAKRLGVLTPDGPSCIAKLDTIGSQHLDRVWKEKTIPEHILWLAQSSRKKNGVPSYGLDVNNADYYTDTQLELLSLMCEETFSTKILDGGNERFLSPDGLEVLFGFQYLQRAMSERLGRRCTQTQLRDAIGVLGGERKCLGGGKGVTKKTFWAFDVEPLIEHQQKELDGGVCNISMKKHETASTLIKPPRGMKKKKG